MESHFMFSRAQSPHHRTARLILGPEGLVHAECVLVVQVWCRKLLNAKLWEVGVVRNRHPQPVRMPRQVVLGDPRATTLVATAVEVSCHRVGVLNALTLLGRLYPLDRVALWLDTDASGVLEEDHCNYSPGREKWRHDPHRELLQPCPVGRPM